MTPPRRRASALLLLAVTSSAGGEGLVQAADATPSHETPDATDTPARSPQGLLLEPTLLAPIVVTAPALNAFEAADARLRRLQATLPGLGDAPASVPDWTERLGTYLAVPKPAPRITVGDDRTAKAALLDLENGQFKARIPPPLALDVNDYRDPLCAQQACP